MTYIDNDDYWSRQWQLEAESEAYFIEQQRLELQNSAGVDMPRLDHYNTYFDFDQCITRAPETEVPF